MFSVIIYFLNYSKIFADFAITSTPTGVFVSYLPIQMFSASMLCE